MSKMASHEPFKHMQPKLWPKDGLGVKLAIWLPTTKSQESTSSRRLQKECDGALESSQGELQLWLRPHSNQRSEPGVMSVQSPRSLTRDSFGTLPWESREKVPFGCGSRGELQRILYGGRWWLPPESEPWWVKWVQGRSWLVSTPNGCKMNSNQLGIGFGCRTM
jgi:hypothetical protein